PRHILPPKEQFTGLVIFAALGFGRRILPQLQHALTPISQSEQGRRLGWGCLGRALLTLPLQQPPSGVTCARQSTVASGRVGQLSQLWRWELRARTRCAALPPSLPAASIAAAEGWGQQRVRSFLKEKSEKKNNKSHAFQLKIHEKHAGLRMRARGT
ncbi:hypothetical protein NDU88_002477, partial [Pleurodeles waltl]